MKIIAPFSQEKKKKKGGVMQRDKATSVSKAMTQIFFRRKPGKRSHLISIRDHVKGHIGAL